MSQLNMNNRQSGRRRGRNNNNNNNRSQSGGRGGVDQANRIDSRARGNGAQMIEKYRNLARDAQLAGDRVLTEYYLQFADHYFRVVSDFRARQEEKAAANGQERSHDRGREIRGVEDFDGHDDTDGDGDGDNGTDDQSDERNDRGDRNDRNDRGQRDNRGNREPRGDQGDDSRGNRPSSRGRSRSRDDADSGNERDERSDDDAHDQKAEAERAPRAARRPTRRPRQNDSGETADAGIDTAVLPPAIGRGERPADADGADEAPAAKPRRTRRTLAARNTDVEAAE
ncbi:DUF4167 domain-containing protein [Sphingopyxis sp. FD7]|jgi:hypothetical protein|uniref:DUF4167 domain-containing protein n=1 Tax=Sphingopyxis sp. FD7 TaxID=1914525 RepID=UPI000E723503|nr:DUF4167 domain-containing protein [Sphingopyxis sp. FD7]